MLDFPHLRTREQRRAAVLRDMLDVVTREALYASGDRVEYVVRKGDEARLQMHLLASKGKWAEA